MERDVLNFNLIVEQCGLNNYPEADVIKKISSLESEYNASELVSIFNYLLMNTENVEVLIHIIKLTDLKRNPATLAILLEKLQSISYTDNDELINLKIVCIKAISNYKDTSTVTILLDCMNNKKEHYRIRLACADALGRIGDKYAVKPLIELLEDETEKSMYLKESATFALGMLGDTSAIDPLVAILESKQGFFDKFSFLKEKIVEALGKLNINNKRVMKALKGSLMDSSPMVRINAIEAIMNSGDDYAYDLIKPSLVDEDDEVKKNALIALYNIIGRNILDEVISLPSYSEFLKNEAQLLIDEYEVDDE